MALARSSTMIHHPWMRTKESIQRDLHAALGEVISGPDAVEFMTAQKEALALIYLSDQVASELRAGRCTVSRMMCLCQQALRAATMGMAQSQDSEHMVNELIKRTMPS